MPAHGGGSWLRLLGAPEEVARAILFLANPDNLTGTSLDGAGGAHSVTRERLRALGLTSSARQYDLNLVRDVS
ncbi:hypothetical protein AB0280_01780 [Pseudarthrobacter sp902506025]|uniref:NAD(P)-dependent dehydrogenase (Short-subunit alcohol dehydrogenase family) n=1 Tax=Pseudarthrobacter defluvii TaxID=410837 RepID=A0ABT9UI37_9MICC|nr:hypothetical protein [Pseudarthrobacter defluvii]MDQ0118706.1 NAD(P)-dependent dehydrogenase (short-subunit alcohol dehydrogenase family) [Pseudarthrobacter defluvii]